MVRDYKLRFLLLDDDIIVCLHRRQATVLPETIASMVLQLIKAIQPEDTGHPITPPARSIELAAKANGPNGRRRTYEMSRTMVKMLNNIATFNEPVSTADVMALCDTLRGTASSKLSMLTTNGYLTRVKVGKYLVSPEGHSYLLEHANK